MSALTRRRPGDPLALAACGGDAAVERGAELQGDERPAEPQAAQETGVDLGRLLGAKTGLDREPGVPQSPEPLARDARIGVIESDDHSPHSGFDQRIDARGSMAPVTTWLETDIG